MCQLTNVRNMTADEAYQVRMREAVERSAKLKVAIVAQAQKQALDPKNWGYVGTMTMLVEQLDAMLEQFPR